MFLSDFLTLATFLIAATESAPLPINDINKRDVVVTTNVVQVATQTNINYVTLTSTSCPESAAEATAAAANTDAATTTQAAATTTTSSSSSVDPDTAQPSDGLVHNINVISRPGAAFKATQVNTPVSATASKTANTAATAAASSSTGFVTLTSSDGSKVTVATTAALPTGDGNASTLDLVNGNVFDAQSNSDTANAKTLTQSTVAATTTSNTENTAATTTSTTGNAATTAGTTTTSDQIAGGDATSSTSEATSTATSSSGVGYLNGAPNTIVYSPYTDSGGCKTYDTVYSDLTLIKSKKISNIRVYGTDCNYLTTVLPIAAKLGLGVNQGFWISSAGVDSIDSAVSEFISAAKDGNSGFDWSLFTVITIGNEAIISGYCSVSDLISKISSVKSQLKSAGYTGKVTTSEPPVSFENNPTLCTGSEIDFVGINPHSYFDTYSSADTAGDFVKGQIEIVQKACPNMDVVVTETGYPNAGNVNGKNVPSPANQRIALQSIFDVVGTDVTILTTFEDLWKQPGEYGIEQSFGMIQLLQ